MSEFKLEQQNEVIQPHYKDAILRIISDYEKSVRSVVNEGDLEVETHARNTEEKEHEAEEYAEVRKDVCESFGVIQDEKHVCIFDKEASRDSVTHQQRAFRAFCVVIDAVSKENFYAEGRTWHVELFNALSLRINDGEQDASAEGIFYGEERGPSRYLFFKGFISNDDFQDLSDKASNVIRTPIFDADGKEIITPSNWFITGHNLSTQV